MSRMHWHPKTGEARVFEDDEKEPDGWLDHHPDSAKGDETDEPVQTGNMTKKEVMDALTSASLPFNSRDNLATLTEQLDKAVSEALAGMQIQVDANMSLRDRLALVEGQG